MSTCERHKGHPENTEMPPEVMLDHFLHCLSHAQRLAALTSLREAANLGNTCFMADHQGLLASQAKYTAKLLAGIREAVDDLLHAEGEQVLSIRDKLKALIS